MAGLNIHNFIKRDIQNIQTWFLKNDEGKEMYAMIRKMEIAGYAVRIQVKPDQEVKGLFFIHQDAIKEARRWPEALSIDATYKTNAHKLSLVNIVGTSNVSSSKVSNRLQTFAIAAAFINSETEDSYTWIMEELRDAIWPIETGHQPPSVIVTDNEQALRNAIEAVFPESQHLLCSWHLWNTMALKLSIGKVHLVEYNLRLVEAELEFKAIMNSHDQRSYEIAIGNFEQIISTDGYFKENGKIAMAYLKDV